MVSGWTSGPRSGERRGYGLSTSRDSCWGDLLADRLRVLGSDHPTTLITRQNLACVRGEAGDTAGAATALAELLADCLRLLGPEHPYTLATYDNLTYWQEQAGPTTA